MTDHVSTRRRPLHVVVSILMVAVAVSSMLVVAVVNFVVTDDLLEGQVREELVALQRSRVQAIVDGLDRRRESIAILASDSEVVVSMLEFRDTFEQLADGPALDDDQRAELRRTYEALLADEALVASIAASGLEVPDLGAALPTDPAAQYLQYHYFVPAAGDQPRRLALDDAGDGSAYSAVHARRHPVLREFAALAGVDDLMLVSVDGNRIVYTTAKGPDLGVDAVASIFGVGGLAEVLVERLPRIPLGDAVLVDLHPYLGAAGEPVMFVAAPIRDGREVVGSLVARLPVDRLNTLMTAGGQWEDVGLGETGETYVVGRDLRLRSDARGWIQDPEAHLRSLRDRGLGDTAAAVETTGATVLVEEIDTDPVRTALDGASFNGRASNLLGREVIAIATPLGVEGIDWVVVAELEVGEATAESSAQLRRLLLLAVVFLPLVAVVGVVLARRLTRPIGPLVSAAEAVASGEVDVTLDDPSRDEFGHLARELERYAEALAAQDAELREQHRAVTDLLEALLPQRVVEAVRDGAVEIGDLTDTATVVAMTIEGVPDSDDDAYANERSCALARVLERLAVQHGLERIWSAHDRHLFLSGLGRDDHGCGDAMRFVTDVRATLEDEAETSELPLTMHAGLAAGTVATGVVGGHHVSFGVWGDAAGIALGLDALGTTGTVLVHGSVTAELTLIDRPPGRSRTITLNGSELEVIELDAVPAV